MSQMPFPKVVAILEGSMEKAFVNANFHYAHVMPLFNGINWSVAAMIKQITTLVETINYDPDLVVVWFDREKRVETADEIIALVRDALLLSGIPDDKLAVVVCDQMTENLFLLDADLLLTEGLFDGIIPDSVGQNGKVVLKRLFRDKGRNYSETYDGVRLLKSLNLEACMDCHPQLGELRARMPDCWWG